MGQVILVDVLHRLLGRCVIRYRRIEGVNLTWISAKSFNGVSLTAQMLKLRIKRRIRRSLFVENV